MSSFRFFKDIFYSIKHCYIDKVNGIWIPNKTIQCNAGQLSVSTGWIFHIYYIKELLGHQHITTTQTYLSATNNDLKKTQNLLKEARLEEESMYNEELMPMPENVIIKDKSMYDKMKAAFPFVERGFSRGVPAYWYWYWYY